LPESRCDPIAALDARATAHPTRSGAVHARAVCCYRSPMRRLASFLLVASSVALLSGCPRQVGADLDGGPGPADSGYDPAIGNRYAGPLSLDDERVRAVDPAGLRAGATPCREPLLARVYRIVDGDTVMVRGETDVVDAPLRMIGVNTPELAHSGQPAECFSAEATTFTSQLEGRLVWLTFDNDCFDPYDRLLGYVHVGAGEGDLWQRQLLRRGYARVLTVGADRTYAGVFGADEAFANMSGVGLWAACF
jgi:endonuclease YncB( thermonuclease family)